MLPEPALFKCGQHTCGLIQALEREGRPLHQYVDSEEMRGETGGDRGVQEDKVSRKWYLLVIALLYVGLIISFCLNVALLLRRGTEENQLLRLEKRVLEDDITGEMIHKYV